MNNKESYEAVLREVGMTEEEVQKQVNANNNPSVLKNVYTAKSNIHGMGLFTSRNVKKGNIICPARIKDSKTIAGRYANHAHYSSAFPVRMNNAIVLLARRSLMVDDEITVDYREVIELNNKK